MSIFLPYRNQLTDFHCTSVDWFLYKFNIGLKWVKEFNCNPGIGELEILLFDITESELFSGDIVLRQNNNRAIRVSWVNL